MSNTSVNDKYKGLMAKALLELREMRVRLKYLEEAKSEPIAIVGMGCRFPGADSPESFWQLLEKGIDAVTEVPSVRWDIAAFYDPDPDKSGKMYTRHGGFLKTVDTFDADFFGITPRELARIDPQQRLLLEVAWEALEHAGIAPESLFGSATGVFVGISSFDYATLQLGLHNAGSIDAYVGTGIALSAANGRLSYLLGLNGPSMAIDTACSSSLVALHLACQSLRNRECGMALAGGVNLILIPELTINFCKARMLAPDGRCKTFDAAADGYVRGEGCGVVVLKRLSDAEADGDTVLAIIRGSAVNQDGSSGGLTVPSGPSQEAVILGALENSRMLPGQVSYVEAHGTGTALGDPIEARSMGKVFGGRSCEHPLLVGSVKTNFGHLEAASGMAGLLKVVLSLIHRKIPAHLHFRNPSPHISWNEMPIEVPTELLDWPSVDGPRIAGVSSFGFSGTNAHIVIEEAPPQKRLVNYGAQAVPGLLTLSAKSDEALEEMVRRYIKYLDAHPDFAIGDICYTANTGRSHFSHRLAICAFSTSELLDKFISLSNDEMREGVFRGRKAGGKDFLSMKTGPKDLSERLLLWAEKYAGGASLDWKGLYREYPCFRIALPTYPFQRQRYWVEPNEAGNRNPGKAVLNPLLGRRLTLPAINEIRFEAVIGLHLVSFLGHHRVYGSAVLPAAVYVEMALAAGAEAFGTDNLSLSSISFVRALILPENGHITLQLVMNIDENDRGTFRIFSQAKDREWILHAEGNLLVGEIGSIFPDVDLDSLRSGLGRELSVHDYYMGFQESGMQYGPLFQAIQELRSSGTEVIGRVQLPGSLAAEQNQYTLHPVLLDSCLQLLRAVMAEEGKDVIWLPTGFSALRLYLLPQYAASLWCHARIDPLKVQPNLQDSALFSASLQLCDDEGKVIVSIEGISARRANREVLLPERTKDENDRQAASSRQHLKDEAQALQSEIASKVINAAREERKGLLLNYIRDLTAEIMGLGSSRKILSDRPVMEQGFDSLMAVELKNMLERDLGKQLPAGLVFNYPSLKEISEFIEKEFFTEREEEGNETIFEATDEFDYLNNMDQSELEALIRKEVQQADI